MKMPALLFCLTGLALSLACGVLQFIAVNSSYKDYRQFGISLSPRELAEFFILQLLGPVTASCISIAMLPMIVRRKSIPKWMVLIGALGATFTTVVLRGGYAHDFSHIFFDACTGYGTLLFRLSAGAAVSLALAYVLLQWVPPGSGRRHSA